MGFLMAAYLAAWIAVAAYLGWLGIQNRALARRIDELEAALGQAAERGADRWAA